MRVDGGEWILGRRMDELFPQQSVSKTWVALTVLDMVDQGKLRLDQKVRITRDDLAVFHQPIRDQVIANGSIEVSVLNLLETSIRASDNTANDSLLRTAGGPQAVNSFIARKNLGAIRFGPGERALQSGIAGLDWNQEYAIGRRFYAARDAVPLAARKAALDRYLNDPIDGASPQAIVRALAKLAKGELLEMASGLQKVTTFGDEAIISTQSMLLTFTKIGREVFPQALEAGEIIARLRVLPNDVSLVLDSGGELNIPAIPAPKIGASRGFGAPFPIDRDFARS